MDNEAAAIEAMKGYAFVSTDAAATVNLSGNNFNTGPQSIALSSSFTNIFNLVGNPYPAAIDWTL